jgi:predicted dehydrogenase
MGQALDTLTTDLEALCVASASLKKAQEAQDMVGIERCASDLERVLGEWKLPGQS